MDMQEMMDFVQRFKNMDMSSLSGIDAQRLTVIEAQKAGASFRQVLVIMDNVFPVLV